MMTTRADFTAPLDCWQGVAEVFSGQYDLSRVARIEGQPRVLDLGANCGAFSVLACELWPGCQVTAYEPQPTIFDYLYRNVASFPNVRPVCAAVSALPVTHAKMRRGVDSRLCASLVDLGQGEQEKEPTLTVPVVHPRDLPEADILKLDVEGAEADVICHLPYVPAALMLEWHSHALRARIEHALDGRMILAYSRVLTRTTGLATYLRA